jgi:hypothetical protein
MGIYSGNPGNVSSALVRTVSGCANNGSGLIRVTTSTSHLFSSTDTVVVANVLGTTEANGPWTITVIDATHFDLVGSTFTHAFVSGGTATDHSLTPAAELPADGEQATAETVLAALQLLFDRTQFLAVTPLAPVRPLLVPPVPMNLSYSQNWIFGSDGTGAGGSAQGSRAVKDKTDDSPLLLELTPFVTPYHGKTLARIDATFAVGQSHSGVPSVLPTMRAYRTQSIATTGVAPATDQSLLSTTDATFPTPGSGAAYYASGQLQSWAYVSDQNNVIDASRRYYVILFDENSTNALRLNSYFGFRVTIT